MSAILITGGAGFIGTNLAYRLIRSGNTVHILDNLSRRNVVRNLTWLRGAVGNGLFAEIADVRDRVALRRILNKVDHVFHLAAQVAVTSSIEDPTFDMDVNLAGTLNLLEEIRCAVKAPSLIYTSTNKVYGALENMPLRIQDKRYVRADTGPAAIDETAQLNFHSPYGCSKGAAEQYVLDYHRTYQLRTAVFRMSCIYGPHQFGTEDQGWVAHIMSHVMAGRPITIYGDGRQVRDILYVDDLVNALLLAREHIDDIGGEAFNIGGGPENTVSLLEFVSMLDAFGFHPNVRFSDWRTGDQKYYVSDTAKFRAITRWVPQTSVKQGVQSLYDWLVQVQGTSDLLVGQAS